jgi:hypothetical protein
MKKYYIIIFITLISLSSTLKGASLFDHFKIDGIGHWRGQVPPEAVMFDYFKTMEIPAAIIVADYSSSPDPLAPCQERKIKTIGNLNVFITPQLKCYDKTVQDTVVFVAKDELFSKRANAKKLYVKTEVGYKVITVAKYMPRLYSVIATNDGYPAVFPGSLRAKR